MSDVIPVKAISSPIKEDRIIAQLTKTKNTPFEFDKIKVDLGENLYIPNFSVLNSLRRTALSNLEEAIAKKYRRKSNFNFDINTNSNYFNLDKTRKHISVLLNTLNPLWQYEKLHGADSVYVPLKYFSNTKFSDILSTLSRISDLYIYLPTIIRNNFKNLFMNTIERSLEIYNIKGFVISNIGTFELLKGFSRSYEFIGNYTLNVFNSETFKDYLNLGLNKVTLSPELNKENLSEINNKFNSLAECIVYGSIPLMTSRYCLLGKSNKCYPECPSNCNTDNKYYLKDRMGFSFRFIPDNMQTVTTIYNSKITSISPETISSLNSRIDILDETVEQINTIIEKVKKDERLEGSEYTNGNLYRNI